MLNTLEALEALYGTPSERAVTKEIPYVNEDYRRFIELSPFAVLASGGPDGLDCSPRGDAPGFVQVLDERTLALPDRPGNNRVDSLRNVLAAPPVALLFLIPGVGEMLRVNGRARISTEPAMLERFAVEGKLPRSVLIVDVDSVYFHCSKAVVRAKLWDPAQQVPRDALPTAGEILRRIGGDSVDVRATDLAIAERVRNNLY